MSIHINQTTSLRQATNNFSNLFGAEISASVEKNSALLVNWLSYLNSYHRTGVADSLLDAVGSSVRETAGVLSLGLVRPTLFSLRGQIDLVLAWLYFKDHGVEWAHINDTADGFKLKKELLSYLELHVPRFAHRIGMLRQIISRNEIDPYRLLSAHVHAQSDPVLPEVVALTDLVRPEATCNECAKMVFEVSEFLNDILLAIYLPSWASLPALIHTELNKRFQTPEQRGAFFS